MTNNGSLFDLTRKVALVTGGSRGLGLGIALALGRSGARVSITARRATWLSDAEAQLRENGIECLAIPCDISDSDQVDATVAATVEHFGGIDVLVNNAGISWGSPIDTMPLTKWREVMETNVTGSFLMARAVGREMIKQGRGGSIVNVSSIAGLVGTSSDVLDAVGYSTSKGALISMTRDLAVKWAVHEIRVNAVAPGFFDTRLSEGVLKHNRTRIEQSTPAGRIGRSGELAGTVVYLAAPASTYVTGQVIAVDGGMTAW
jgi:gluconate 5-dehydrogenase